MRKSSFDTTVFAPEYSDTFSTREAAENLFSDPRFKYNSQIMSTVDLKLNQNYTFNDNTKITSFGFENYMSAIGIPNVFAKKIPIDLLMKNQLELKEKFEKPIKIFTRESDGAIVNVTNAGYKSISTKEILKNIPDEFLNNGSKIQNSFISTKNIKLLFNIPLDSIVEPTPGDIIKFGKVITNSEIGINALTASMMTFRLVCLNGAIMGSEWGRIVRKHNGDLPNEEIINNFINSYNVLLPDSDKVNEAFTIMKNENVYIDEMVNIYGKVMKTLRQVYVLPEHSKEDVEKIDNTIAENLKLNDIGFSDCIEKIKDRKKALKNPFEEIPEREKHPTLTYYNLFNKITEVPHLIRNNVKATNEIEVLGGQIINQVLKNFNSQIVEGKA